MTVWSGDNSEVLRLWIVIFGCTAHLRKRKVKWMNEKEARKERLKIYGLVVFLVALFGLAIACAIYAVILVGKYGNMPVEEVPLWVWWFIS